MHRKRHNIAIQSRGCFRHTNTLWPSIRHTHSRDSKASVVVLTDSKNQKIEHQTIQWEYLTFPEHCVVSNPKPPALKRIASGPLLISNRTDPLFFSLSLEDLLLIIEELKEPAKILDVIEIHPLLKPLVLAQFLVNIFLYLNFPS